MFRYALTQMIHQELHRRALFVFDVIDIKTTIAQLS